MPDMPYFVRCQRAPFGWYCQRQEGHVGVCNARARWWNLVAQVRDLMGGF